jgi:hypothetical protein
VLAGHDLRADIDIVSTARFGDAVWDLTPALFEGNAGTSASGFRGEVEAEHALARGEDLTVMVDATNTHA